MAIAEGRPVNALLEGLLGALVAITALPVLVLMMQVIGAWGRSLRSMGQASALGGTEPASITVLMPAHDEAEGIARSIHAVLPQLRKADRLLVVADNCGDDTAARARAAGAEVIERSDPQHRGKGYALAFGMHHLAASPPEVVIILDADCLVGPDAIPRLGRQAVARQAPVQAHYRMQLPADATLLNKVSAFAWRVKTLVRPLGFQSYGLPCQLMGSGMAFPMSLLARFNLGGSHLVEDLQLGLDMTCAGAAPSFDPGAEVISSLPPTAQGSRRQRTRWEHGHLGMMARLPSLIALAVRKRSFALLAAALDLSVPPLALLVITLFALSALALAACILLNGWTPLLLVLGIDAVLGLSVFLAWARFGRDVLSSAELAAIPLYVLWKIPVYLSFVFRRERAWVRTQRGPSP